METFTFEFTFEPEIDGFCVGSFDCRAHVEVSSDGDGEDWHVERLEMCGVKYERPHAGDLKAKRTERYFKVDALSVFYAAMLAEAERLTPDAIDRAYSDGEIGPAARAAALADARAAALADYYNDLAKEDRPLLIASPTMQGRA